MPDKSKTDSEATPRKGPRKDVGFKHFLRSCGYSAKGFRAAWREAAFRQECLLGLVTLPLAFWLGHSPLSRFLVCLAWLIVLLTELLNSAVEAVVDLASPGFHELAGRAKDLASAAVTVSLAIYGASWLYLFITN